MSTALDTTVPSPTIVSPAQWLDARKALLQKEKQLTHLNDELTELRRQLPWVKVEKPYSFETPCGTHPLADLFGDKSQLIVYHFMFGPGWDEGCPVCSMIADQLNALGPHIRQRDVSLMLVSRAPLEKVQAFKARMGWDNLFWASAANCDFNEDFGVALTEGQIQSGGVYNYGTQDFRYPEAPGLSAFTKSGHDVYHTYSTYGRGLERVMGVYPLLDVVPAGRNETGLAHGAKWVKHHDKYGEEPVNQSVSKAMNESSCGCR